MQKRIERELAEVRPAVEAELADGRGRACVVEALRASPQRPDWVREYGSLEEFVEEDRRRAVFDWPVRRDASGADFGGRWGLEDPFKRWRTSAWRVSWLGPDDEPTHEVYAIERRPQFRRQPDDSRFGRVWVLGVLPDWESVRGALDELQMHAQDERNSLIAAARSVQAVSRRLHGPGGRAHRPRLDLSPWST